MIPDALDLDEFKRVATAISKTVAEEAAGENLVSIAYQVEQLVLGIACNEPGSIVLSLGDSRISLSYKQVAVLRDLIKLFSDSMELT